MLAFKNLCSRCKQINFDALRGPPATDIERLATGRASDHWTAQVIPGTNLDKVELGTLIRIRKDAADCPLCALFYQIINRQGAVYWYDSAYETLDSTDIQFRADFDLSYYAKIGGLNTASTEVFVFRRLCLTAHAPRSPNYAIAYFDHVLQVCDVGALSVPARDPETQADHIARGMPFGGRKRPPILDLQLVHNWMQFCADEHGQLCLLDLAQVDGTG